MRVLSNPKRESRKTEDAHLRDQPVKAEEVGVLQITFPVPVIRELGRTRGESACWILAASAERRPLLLDEIFVGELPRFGITASRCR